MTKSRIAIPLFNLFAASLMSVLLRVAHVWELPWLEFRKMMYGHFHVSLLGWFYLIAFVLIMSDFMSKGKAKQPVFQWLFWIAQLSVLGMIFSFPKGGYNYLTVFLVSLHMVTAIIFAVLTWNPVVLKKTFSMILHRTALVWMIISTVGIWVVIWLTLTNTRNLALYHMAVQFFLHFQLNGWLTFFVMAFYFRELEKRGFLPDQRNFMRFYVLLVISSVFTYSLSVAWSNPHPVLFFLNGAGVLIQIAALGILFILTKKAFLNLISGTDLILRTLFIVAALSFIAKILIQAAVVLPQVAVISYTIRQFVVGFIHLAAIGSLTLFIFGILFSKGIMKRENRLFRYGTWMLILSFIASEILLFLQGLFLWLQFGFIPLYYEVILIFTIFLSIGLFFVLIGFFAKFRITEPSA